MRQVTFTQMTRRHLLGTAAALLTVSSARGDTANLLDEVRKGTAVPGMAAVRFHSFQADREIVSGIRRLGSTDPIRPGDRWHLGSDGKAITATLISRLCEQRVLSWREPLVHMLPEISSAMHPSYRDVTLADLLSHRSGLPEVAGTMDFLVTFVDDPAPYSAQRRRYVEAALAEPPVGQKRAKPSYSNSGFIVAAAIAERAARAEYEALMQTHIFGPLGMSSVTYEPFSRPDEAVGHVDGRIADQRLDPNPRVFSPSDGVRLSLADWSAFCLDQMRGHQGAGRLMQGDAYRFMQTSQGGTMCALGWMTQANAHGRRGPAIFHSGSNGNWMAEALLFPRIGDGVLVVANSAYRMDGDKAAAAAVRRIAQTLSVPAES